jgi:hypothetical protein
MLDFSEPERASGAVIRAALLLRTCMTGPLCGAPVGVRIQEGFEIDLGDAPLASDVYGPEIAALDPTADGRLVHLEDVGNVMSREEGSGEHAIPAAMVL